MKEKPLILFLEDVPADFTLVNHQLRRSGLVFEARQAESKEAFIKELEEHPPDLILSDHGLHEFDAFAALSLAKEKAPNVPVIFVTGSLDEQGASRALQSGAADYVPKHRLVELPPAVRRALGLNKKQPAATGKRKSEIRASNDDGIEATPAIIGLADGDVRFRWLVESVQDYAIYLLDRQGQVTSWNQGAEMIHGYRAEEIIGRNHSAFFCLKTYPEAGRRKY